MKGFLEKLQKKPKSSSSSAGAASSSHSSSSIRGGGKALGGNKAGKVLPMTLTSSGPMGVQLENTQQGSAIVAGVTPGSPAEMVGLKRGDIFCFSGTDGKEEIPYRMFLDMVKSDVRPLVFDVRRIDSLLSSSSSSNISSASSKSNVVTRADAEARRLAVIAAAEARDQKHKQSKKPIRKGLELTAEQRKKIEMQREQLAKTNAEMFAAHDAEPLSEEAKRAVDHVKSKEAMHAAELGYNPYETMKGTGKQASNVVTTLHHGELNSDSSSQQQDPQLKAKEKNEKTRNVQQGIGIMAIDPAFDEALAMVVSNCRNNNSEYGDKSSEVVKKSLRVMRKLIQNATMEGQTQDKKRVRLSNPNPHIEAAIHNVHGALDLMMSVGFVVMEEEEEGCGGDAGVVGDSGKSSNHASSSSETFLVYSPPDNRDPVWLSKALKQMEEYENQLLL